MVVKSVKHSHCSWCGGAFAADSAWPRTCPRCNRMTWLNPLPVAVLVQPVDEGVLVIRRGEASGRGLLALPGGFIDHGETWQQACARELREETGLEIDSATVRELAVRSSPDGFLLVFGVAPRLTASALPPFTPSSEILERLVVTSPIPLAFSLHEEILRLAFAAPR